MPDEQTTLRDSILTSPSGQRMLSRVSPIYDDSYVGLWLFQAIGLEYDGLWEIMRTLPDQLMPETATWGLPLWERKYHLPSTGTDEERRARIAKAQRRFAPFTPAKLESWILELFGVEVKVTELTPPNRFSIQVISGAEGNSNVMRMIRDFVKKVKPSHLIFDMAFQSSTTIYVQTSGEFDANDNIYRG